MALDLCRKAAYKGSCKGARDYKRSSRRGQNSILGEHLFTGLIREIADVKSLSRSTLNIRSKHKEDQDSIAVNGACLTVIKSRT